MSKKSIKPVYDKKTLALFENPQLGVYTTDEETSKIVTQRRLLNPICNITIFLICTFKIIFLSLFIITICIILILTKPLYYVI